MYISEISISFYNKCIISSTELSLLKKSIKGYVECSMTRQQQVDKSFLLDQIYCNQKPKLIEHNEIKEITASKLDEK